MYKYIIYLILLLDLTFFYLVPLKGFLASIITNYQKLGLSIIVISIFFIYAKTIFKKRNYYFTKEVFLFIILIIIEIIISYFMYSQGLKTIMIVANHYFIILAYFIFCYWIDNRNDIEFFEKVLIFCVIAISSILLLQYFIYNSNGNLFLNIDKSRLSVARRYGSIRLYESSYFITVGSVLALGILIKDNVSKILKMFSAIAAVLSLSEIILVFKGRINLILILISFLFMIIIKYKTKKIKKIIIVSITIVGLLFFINIDSVSRMINTFSLQEDSVSIRINAIEYYMNQLKDYPIFGTGFIDAKKNDWSFSFVRGNKGVYYKDDMGLIGFINTFGIIGLILIFIILYKIVRILRRIYKIRKHEKYIEIFGAAFLIIIGTILLNPFDSQRIIFIPILLALLDNISKIEHKKLKIKSVRIVK